jgi:hypothetical protein
VELFFNTQSLKPEVLLRVTEKKMKRTNMLTLVAILLTSLFSAEYAAAQTDGIVEINNISGEGRKICMYRSDMLVLVPYKCFELNTGRKVIWSREGDRSSFIVKVFKPALLIDKYLYTRHLPGRTTWINMGKGGMFGYSTDKPKPPVTKYRLRVCNQQSDDKVYFTLGFETNAKFFTEGWWNLKKGECMEVGVSERLKKVIGLEYGNTPRTFYYARTYGGIPQQWDGGTEGRPVCVNNKKAFRTLYERGKDGNYLPSPCGGDGQEQVSFRLLGEPKADQEYYYLTF